MSCQATGGFQQRSRISDRATLLHQEKKRIQAAVRTHEALRQFEEHLIAEEEAKFKDYDDIADDAGEYARRSKPPRSKTQLSQEAPAPIMQRDPATKKPPSPLTLYDYGCVSTKPRSLLAQHRQRLGESSRPKHRQTSCGFYFPGAHFKHGSYGFSMIDPVLMPPRSWASSQIVAECGNSNLHNARPLSVHALGLKRNRSEGELLSPIVRSTNGHNLRARNALSCLDHAREERVLEHVRFENGVYEGRWRDPLLDTKGQIPEASNPEHEWLANMHEEMNSVRQLTSRVLFGVHDAAQRSRGGIKALFAAENKGGPGVLEPRDFLHGLVRLGIFLPDEISTDRIVGVINTIDPSSDGRMKIPALDRAVAVARGVHRQQREASEKLLQDREVFLNTKYSDSLPVDVIKLDKQSKSLYNFERSMEKFRSQQRGLLVHHRETDD